MASMASIQIFQLDLLVDGGREIRAPQRGDPPAPQAGGYYRLATARLSSRGAASPTRQARHGRQTPDARHS